MAYAASFDVMSDTNAQVDRSFTSCSSVADWVVASQRHPAAIDGVDPYAYLANSCDASSGRSLGATPVCVSLASQPAHVATPIAYPRTPAPVAQEPGSQQSFAQVSNWTWSKIMKSPDDYVDEALQVWACISQFDAATGADTFRGEALNRKAEYWYLDTDNAMFTGDEDRLADFVKDDVVSMNVVGAGSYSYDTQTRRQHHRSCVRGAVHQTSGLLLGMTAQSLGSSVQSVMSGGQRRTLPTGVGTSCGPLPRSPLDLEV